MRAETRLLLPDCWFYNLQNPVVSGGLYAIVFWCRSAALLVRLQSNLMCSFLPCRRFLPRISAIDSGYALRFRFVFRVGRFHFAFFEKLQNYRDRKLPRKRILYGFLFSP